MVKYMRVDHIPDEPLEIEVVEPIIGPFSRSRITEYDSCGQKKKHEHAGRSTANVYYRGELAYRWHRYDSIDDHDLFDGLGFASVHFMPVYKPRSDEQRRLVETGLMTIRSFGPPGSKSLVTFSPTSDGTIDMSVTPLTRPTPPAPPRPFPPSFSVPSFGYSSDMVFGTTTPIVSKDIILPSVNPFSFSGNIDDYKKLFASSTPSLPGHVFGTTTTTVTQPSTSTSTSTGKPSSADVSLVRPSPPKPLDGTSSIRIETLNLIVKEKEKEIERLNEVIKEMLVEKEKEKMEKDAMESRLAKVEDLLKNISPQ